LTVRVIGNTADFPRRCRLWVSTARIATRGCRSECALEALLGMVVLLVAFPLAGCDGGAGGADGRKTPTAQGAAGTSTVRSGYAPIGALNMYYEVHGSGPPLLLIHGALSTIQSSFGALLPELTKHRQVTAIEQQGHGHTADVDRPLTFEQMADDAAALLRYLKIEKTDVFGYSDGGNVGLALAMRHPDLVRKLVIAGTNYDNDGLDPKILELIRAAATKPKEEVVKDIPPQFSKAYAEVAPKPDNWSTLALKVMQQAAAFRGWTPDQIRMLAAPTLIIIADRDIVRPEHAVDMFRLQRDAQLAVIPGRDHIALVEQPGVLGPIVQTFLDAPMPKVER
jgi:pimeloyl-ACP methyl ester carboxylesterase